MNLFHAHWREHIKTFPTRYQRSEQIVHGSRLRPLLVAWGCLLAGDDFDDSRRAEVSRLSVYVELLHKATILIDDLIDRDDARNGQPSFHAQFSDSEAILFAIYLVGDSLERLSRAIESDSETWHQSVTQLLSTAIKEMASGAIEEVISSRDQLAVFENTKRLIEMQTIALMKNGLLTGYKLGQGSEQYAATIESLGYDSGYMFQVLNDLEPFLGQELNAFHKGSVNFDVLRSRKNITVAFIFNRLSSSEQRQFQALLQSADSRLPVVLGGWFAEYNVLRDVIANLADVNKNIEANVHALPLDWQRQMGFCAFVNYVLAAAIRRIGGTYGEKLSDILIR
jgi:geranylgeranyl pyrophosphate synthase